VPENAEQLNVISVVLCDDIFRDEQTKKLALIGLFSEVSAPAFPAVHPRLCVLVTVTNGRGRYDLHVALEHERTGAEVFRVGGPFEVDDPLAVVDLDLRVQGLPLPDAGKYWLKVMDGARILQQRPFMARRSEDSGQGPEQEERR
jgi:hypothetical protein